MFRVATYNLHHGVGASGRFDLSALLDACRTLDADVLALAELDRRSIRTRFCDQPRRIAEATGLVAHFAVTRDLGPLGRHGLALLTPAAARRVEEVPLVVGEHRTRAIVADVVAPRSHDVFAVAVAHLHKDQATATRQLDALLEHLDRRLGTDRPVLLMGDLNCDAGIVEPRLESHGLRAAVSGPTFPASDPRRRIDWIAGRGIELSEVRVPELAVSDHRPVLASCRLA